MIKLSKAGKMPCKSFSIPARDTCPGAYFSDGTLKPVCAGCYATKGFYNMPVVKDVRKNNVKEVEKDSFVDEMVELIYNQKGNYFRWFDSGDIYCSDFLVKIIDICKQTPHIKHWIPTKSRDLFDNDLWEQLENLSNVRVRFSSPSIKGYFGREHGSTVVEDAGYFSNDNPGKVYNCPASKQKGKCGPCRACWSKKIDVIAYLFH